jgi:mRNA interferase RelE/StbE
MDASLRFHQDALKEWRLLDEGIRRRLKKRLAKRLENPAVPAAILSGSLSNCYKIRDSSSGYRLVYQHDPREQVLFVLAVAKRESKAVYKLAVRRKD